MLKDMHQHSKRGSKKHTKGDLGDKTRMSAISKKTGSLLTKYLQKLEKGVNLGELRNDFLSSG